MKAMPTMSSSFVFNSFSSRIIKTMASRTNIAPWPTSPNIIAKRNGNKITAKAPGLTS